MQNIQNEVNIMRSLSHSGIVKFYECGDEGIVTFDTKIVIS